LGLALYYSKTRTSLLGRKSIVFIVERNGELETIEYLLKDYESSTRLLSKQVRPFLNESDVEWAYLDRMFILHLLQDAGLVQHI